MKDILFVAWECVANSPSIITSTNRRRWHLRTLSIHLAWFGTVGVAGAQTTDTVRRTGMIVGRAIWSSDSTPAVGVSIKVRTLKLGARTKIGRTDRDGTYAIEVQEGLNRVTAFGGLFGLKQRIANEQTLILSVPAESTLRQDFVLTGSYQYEPKPIFASRFFNILEPNYFITGVPGIGRGFRPGSSGDLASQVKFRVAFRYELASFAENAVGIFAGYRQNSFWHLFEPSAPFFDNNYNPMLFARVGIKENCELCSSTALRAFVEHESNGRDGADSRSWNRIGLQYDFGDRSEPIYMYLKHWKAWGVAPENRDLPDRAGRGEVGFVLQPWVDGEPRAGQWMAELKLRIDGKPFVASSEIDLFFDLPAKWLTSALMVQLFHGTGEDLRTYDRRRTSLRVGLATVR